MEQIPKPLPFMRRLRRDRSGVAALELALVSSILVGILIPTFDLGMGAYQKMRVQDAAEAGAQYALTSGYSAAAITSAAQNATSLGAGVTVTPSESCNCITGGTIGSSVACGSTCPDGSTAGTYVTVATQATYTLLVSYPGLASPMTLNGSAIVRIN